MWKKRLTGAAIACMLLLAGVMPVHAGDINAAEQRIIDYYNGTVTYQGKTYRFTEEGKQKAYNRLMDDDVDLTEREVDSAIRQANANLQRGIDEGYMVEVTDTDPNPDTENPNPGNTETPGTETPDIETPGTETDNPGNQGQTPGNLPGTNGGGTSAGNSNGQPGNTNILDSNNQNPGGMPNDSGMQKTDVQELLKNALEEGDYATINTGTPQGTDGQNSNWAITVEQLLKGTVDVVTKDGSVILSGGLPIKNTGYFTGGIIWALLLFIAMTGVALAIITWRKKKGYFSMPVIASVAGIVLFAIFAGGYLESEAGKWQSVWILGTPEYTYAAEAEEAETDRTNADGAWIPPLQGEQYGELLCEDIELRAPLYYGDTADILEQGAGTYTGGSLPGMGGAIIAGGHDGTFFAPLESIQEGMVFTLKTSYGQYEYEVTGTEVMDVMDYKARRPDTEELVLYTCYPFGTETELRNERFFVYAKKVSGPEIGE